jgi:ABC-type multidrug transport system fused ATPase/permease subunit
LVAGTVLVVATVMVLRAALGERFASSLPLVAVYLVAMRRVLAASARLVQARLRVVEHMALACHVYEEIDAPPRVVPAAGGAGHPPLRQGIVCQDVGLVFAGRPPVLNGVSVAIRAGEVTAIVGPSGAGKSSLLNLIVRLFDPTRGVVLVDGEDLAHLDLRAWRRRIGFVAQESFLVHGSVADNIVLGRPATAAQVEAAARRAGADAFVRSLPAGYQTVVGEQGLKLSGGQRQLLGIARAMLTGPEIVIFDEATSSLDSRSEALVQQAIQVVSEGRTVIVVAHRLSTIEHADRIIVLDRGRVVGQGTHASLLDACGVYRMLYSRQHAHLPGQTPVPALAH